jgi:hypothetical protein
LKRGCVGSAIRVQSNLDFGAGRNKQRAVPEFVLPCRNCAALVPACKLTERSSAFGGPVDSRNLTSDCGAIVTRHRRCRSRFTEKIPRSEVCGIDSKADSSRPCIAENKDCGRNRYGRQAASQRSVSQTPDGHPCDSPEPIPRKCVNSWHVCCVLFMRDVRIRPNCIHLQHRSEKLPDWRTHGMAVAAP